MNYPGVCRKAPATPGLLITLQPSDRFFLNITFYPHFLKKTLV